MSTTSPNPPSTFEIPGDVRLVLFRLKKRGFQAYLVGPCVRDAISTGSLDKSPRVDLVVVAPNTAEIERTLEGTATTQFFLSKPERVRRSVAFNIQNASDGVVVRKVVAQDVPTYDALLDELSRREVTVNAIAMGEGGELIDPYKGAQDVLLKQIRPLQSAQQAFTLKPVNLVKIAKNVAYHGYAASPDTLEWASRQALCILDVPVDRIRPEFERMLVNLYPDMGLDFLERCGVLKYLLPEVQGLVGFDDSCEVHHKDIWDHTKKVVLRSKSLLAIRWAALLHDIGKVWTRTVDDRGSVHFFRHEELSAHLFRGIAARFALDDRVAQRIHFLVLNHSRINMYTSEWTDSAIRRMLKETGDYLEDLLCLSRADITSRQERRVEELTGLLDELEMRIRAVREEDARQPPLPKGIGNAIMEHFGLQPGPLVGQLREALEAAVEAGSVPRNLPIEEYLEYLHAYIHQQGKNPS